MSLYIRAYEDYSFELIFTEGKVRKKRIHLLVNPGPNVKIGGLTKATETHVNVQSLTHIITMESSVLKPQLIKRTTKIAEMTNKPIITNRMCSEKFREKGISVKQLRILGFQDEVIEGLYVDPIYKEEIDNPDLGMHRDETDGFANLGHKIIEFTKTLPKRVNPLKWRSVKKITNTLTGEEGKEGMIEPANPLALYIRFTKSDDLIIPLDKRGLEHIDELLPEVQPKLIILPNIDVSDTLQILHKARAIIVFNRENKQSRAMIIPKTYNPDAKHDTIYAPFKEWIDIEELF